TECPVSTSDGVKLVDTAWMSRQRFDPMREFSVFEKAPEICVEVLSPSNTRAEMEEKQALYFEIGCEEFWTVGSTGKVRFFAPDGAELDSSAFCPEFPDQIEI
ncbi:MAG: Uma2 family endonuclease, partial [Verrucomicrobiales bacterium]